jgi:hypothetical protein
MRTPRNRGKRHVAGATYPLKLGPLYGPAGRDAAFAWAVSRVAERAAERQAAVMNGKFLCQSNPAHGLQNVKNVTDGELVLQCGCHRAAGRFEHYPRRRRKRA